MNDVNQVSVLKPPLHWQTYFKIVIKRKDYKIVYKKYLVFNYVEKLKDVFVTMTFYQDLIISNAIQIFVTKFVT